MSKNFVKSMGEKSVDENFVKSMGENFVKISVKRDG